MTSRPTWHSVWRRVSQFSNPARPGHYLSGPDPGKRADRRTSGTSGERWQPCSPLAVTTPLERGQSADTPKIYHKRQQLTRQQRTSDPLPRGEVASGWLNLDRKWAVKPGTAVHRGMGRPRGSGAQRAPSASAILGRATRWGSPSWTSAHACWTTNMALATVCTHHGRAFTTTNPPARGRPSGSGSSGARRTRSSSAGSTISGAVSRPRAGRRADVSVAA
jgi:hypothetical protein